MHQPMLERKEISYSDMNWDGHSDIWNVECCKWLAVLDSFQWRLAHKDVSAAIPPLQKFWEKLNICNKIFHQEKRKFS
jgi:hypothetical protein